MARKGRGDRGGRVTMADVAREVGVSAITVSRALRQPDLVSEALATRIAETCARLGYVRSRAASALASSRSRTILVLIPSLSNMVFVDTLVGIKEVLDDRDYQMLIAITGYDDPDAEERLLRQNLGYAPDGVLLTGVDQSEAVWSMLRAHDIHAIHMMDVTTREDCSWVGFSNVEAGRAVGNYLVGRNRRRVGLITSQLDPRSLKRLEGCREVLTEHGLYDPDLDQRVPDRSTIALGAELVERLLDRAPDCDAVFISNDDMAQGAVYHCHQRGILVPEKLAIIGFHDLTGSAWTIAPLTTVRTPRARIGRESARLLLDVIEGRRKEPARLDLGFSIIRRASG